MVEPSEMSLTASSILIIDHRDQLWNIMSALVVTRTPTVEGQPLEQLYRGYSNRRTHGYADAQGSSRAPGERRYPVRQNQGG